MPTDLSWMKERHEQLLESGLAWEPPILESANAPRCTINGVEMIMLSEKVIEILCMDSISIP